MHPSTMVTDSDNTGYIMSVRLAHQPSSSCTLIACMRPRMGEPNHVNSLDPIIAPCCVQGEYPRAEQHPVVVVPGVADTTWTTV